MNAHDCTEHAAGAAACYYRHACRCDACRRSALRRSKLSKAGLATIDATPTRDHITRLLAHGWLYSSIGVASGLGTGHAAYLHNEAKQTHRKAADAILAIDPTTTTEGTTYDATGTTRRVRALVALGWPMPELSARAGFNPGHLHQVTLRRSVTAETRERVRALYGQLWNTAGPSATSAARAKAAGWAPPAAWDDDDGPHGIDNPDATPSGVRTSDGRRGHTADDLADAIETGACLVDLERRFGMRPVAIEKALRRAGHADLWNRTRPAEVTPRKVAA